MENKEALDLAGAEALKIASEAVKVLFENKGIDVQMYDVREKSPITDFYVNASGRSTTQVAALADDVVDELGKRGAVALRVEGRRDNNWLLIDFGDVIVNVFDRPTRDFYALDRHFPPESRMDTSELEAEVDAKLDLMRK